MITVIVVEGVLARGDDLRNAAPTKIGKPLYDGLHWTSNIIGLTLANQEIVRWWLKREHLHDWSSVLSYPGAALTWEQWRVDQVRGFLAEGWEIYAYIDTDPVVLEQVRALGVATISLSFPDQPPGWKEVAAPRAWSDVVATVDGDTVPWKD